MNIRKPAAGAHDSGGSQPAPQNAGAILPESPESIRAEIEVARADLGNTVEALAAKADVKARVRGAADDARGRVADSLVSGADTVKAKTTEIADWVRSADVQQVTAGARDAAHRLQVQVKARPVPFAIAAAVAVLAVVAVNRRRNR